MTYCVAGEAPVRIPLIFLMNMSYSLAGMSEVQLRIVEVYSQIVDGHIGISEVHCSMSEMEDRVVDGAWEMSKIYHGVHEEQFKIIEVHFGIFDGG